VSRGRRRVEWTEAARGDLLGIVEYLLATNPGAASRVLDRIERKARTLRAQPLRGRLVPELLRLQVRSYRELQVPPYRVIYRVEEDAALVLAIFDGRRNLEDVILERILSRS